ncbi:MULTISPECIES: LCP family protein [unclassified Breznakia]|uniref:LCP family glycopolymer transferase n=1 Tax=unclassified Breznakia TaxID=2623764 RepID=UPI002404CB7D|nr:MULTISPECIES: LCP family protein [unclassified Breznakia]MDF9838256.1 LCP family protein required for cell wall assembly [Breznakia sp. PFB2-8]MDF9860272.1 LCP family protein required for cell wall assembly [Breznakia sp. PH5-24]
MGRLKKSRIADYVLLITLTLLMALSCYYIWDIKSLPEKWRIAALAIFLLIYLIFLALSFKKMSGKPLWGRRFMIVILCGLYGFSAFYAHKGVSSIRQITNTNQDKYITITVIAKNDSNLESDSDLSDKKVGVQDGLDKENANYGKKQLNKVANNINYVKEESYLSLAEKMDANDIDAMIITSSYLQHVEAEREGYTEGIKTIATYKRKVTNTNTSENTKDLTKEPFTILLSGVDTTDDGEASLRSDVNMILIVNPLTNHVEMVSFPRDAYIPNLALGGGDDKLTHTSNDGIENTMDSLDDVIGFDIDFYVQVNFTSVVQIVDAIGGIEVDVPIAFEEQNSKRSFAPEDLIVLDKGLQTLNGEESLALARHRKTYGDIERTQAQQLVVKGIANKLLTKDGATKVPALLDIVPKYVKTNISYDQLSDFINNELNDLSPWTFGNTSMDHGGSYMLTTASMGSNTPLSCYVLSMTDLDTLYKKYQMIIKPTTFKKFAFDLNDLGAQLPSYEEVEGVTYLETYSGGNVQVNENTDFDDDYIPETETPYIPEEEPVEEPVEKPVEPIVPDPGETTPPEITPTEPEIP